jgi:hypothetical protein
VPGGHVGQFAAGGQLFGGGDRIGAGATGAHRIAQAVTRGRILALAAGVEVAIPHHCLAPAHLAVGGGLLRAGRVTGRRLLAGFRRTALAGGQQGKPQGRQQQAGTAHGVDLVRCLEARVSSRPGELRVGAAY